MLQSPRRQAQAYGVCVCVSMYCLYAKYNRNIGTLWNILKNTGWAEVGFFNPMKRCNALSLYHRMTAQKFGADGKNTLNFHPPQWRYVFVSLLEMYFVKNCQSYSVHCHYMCSWILTWHSQWLVGALSWYKLQNQPFSSPYYTRSQ